ncbi:hypothetical protein FKW77_002467 [Venturia effusa]|uniref:BTB domain-containing protein n=1 Tax=Venturia effusa TaxID=50376 RepID=A0A517LK09_9PEZI|nr:hypothetical protein FKW77_002467 [Venturia effusa]
MSAHSIVGCVYLEDDRKQDWTKTIEVIVGRNSTNISSEATESPHAAPKIDEEAAHAETLKAGASDSGIDQKTDNGNKVDEKESHDEEMGIAKHVPENRKGSDEDDPMEEGDDFDQEHDESEEGTLDGSYIEGEQDRDEEEKPDGAGPPIQAWPEFDSGPKRFVIHETIVRQQSPFFEKALSCECYKECQERVVKLPNHIPAAFEVYINWANGHRVHLPSRLHGEEGDRISWLLIHAYILGDYLQDVDFKDAVIDALIHFCLTANWIPYGTLQFIWENTAPDARLRHVITAIMVDNGFATTVYDKCFYFQDADFFRAIMARM